MMEIFGGVIIGALLGILWTLVVNRVSNNGSKGLPFLNIVFGALGSVAANQLLTWGPAIMSLSLLPTLAGGLVLPIAATYAFLKLRKRYGHSY